MSAYFITGSGTGVGKTFTTCALLHACKTAKGYKPIISGYGKGQNDTTLIAQYSGNVIANVSPWRFKAPLSPDMAAAKEGRKLKRGELVKWTKKIVKQKNRVFIETVGGLMVPLNDKHTTRDWLAKCDIPLILVTGSYLGALSHTLATIEAARAAKLKIRALIINESVDGVDLAATKRSLANHCGDIPLILAQPRVASPKKATVIHRLCKSL